MEVKSNVTIYLSGDVLERCKAAAAADNRSLSNYLGGLLERAHPVESVVHSAPIALAAGELKRAVHRKNMAARAERMAARARRSK